MATLRTYAGGLEIRPSPFFLTFQTLSMKGVKRLVLHCIRKKRVIFAGLMVCIIIAVTLIDHVCLFLFMALGFKDPVCLFPFRALGWTTRLQPDDNTDLTIVTAYFHLVSFQKGKNPDNQRTPQKYFDWASPFRFMQNPLVVFTDSAEFEEHFKRNVLQHTTPYGRSSSRDASALPTGGGSSKKRLVRVVRIQNRTELFAFQKLERVREIFRDPSYPKFHPNTVLPEYACSQHAKFDLVERAIRENVFDTKYFAWLDLGYFRYATERQRDFWLAVPRDLDDGMVAASEVTPPNASATSAEQIFKENQFWVGGGMFLGTAAPFLRLVHEYHAAVDYFLARGLFNTDQQMLFSMLKDPEVKAALGVTSQLQLFSWPYSWYQYCWFYFGFQCYRET